MGCASSKDVGESASAAMPNVRGASIGTPREEGPHAQALQRVRHTLHSVEQFTEAVRAFGTGSVRLMVAFDLTKANTTQGAQSFHGQSLHALDPENNPYKMVLEVLASALLPLDASPCLHMLGFGDFISQDSGLVDFSPDAGLFRNTADAIAGYNKVLREAHLSGPINWAPAIHHAISAVQLSGGRFHTLAILTCGPVDRMHEQATIDAIVLASYCALQIVVVGLGDGPWKRVLDLQSRLPGRPMDNFSFVPHETVFLRARRLRFDADRTSADFAVAALKNLPDLYVAAGKLGYLGSGKQREVKRIKVYSPFDVGAGGSIRPLPPKQLSTQFDEVGRSSALADMSSHSANPLFANES